MRAANAGVCRSADTLSTSRCAVLCYVVVAAYPIAAADGVKLGACFSVWVVRSL